MSEKIAVEMIVEHSKEGIIFPLIMIWDDGREFYIDNVLNIKSARSLKIGGSGIRYRCKIRNKYVYLWLDENIWYLEVENPNIKIMDYDY